MNDFIETLKNTSFYEPVINTNASGSKEIDVFDLLYNVFSFPYVTNNEGKDDPYPISYFLDFTITDKNSFVIRGVNLKMSNISDIEKMFIFIQNTKILKKEFNLLHFSDGEEKLNVINSVKRSIYLNLKDLLPNISMYYKSYNLDNFLHLKRISELDYGSLKDFLIVTYANAT